MQVVRRLYLYATSLVSLEIIIWGCIGLLRSVFSRGEIGGGASQLASALALILVGVPVFLIHWRVGERAAQKNEEERSSRIRAIFFYLVLAFTLVPITQNLLAFLDRSLLELFGVWNPFPFFGGQQTWSDNLVAILVNGGAAAYFLWYLRQDWQRGFQGNAFAETRRLYRYFWLLYSLVLVFFGLQQLIQFLMNVWFSVGNSARDNLAHGLALLILGTPVWLYTNRSINRALVQSEERESFLRLIVLYLIVFISIASLVIACGMVLYEILRVILGEAFVLAGFLNRLAGPLSVALPMGMIWAYYGRILAGQLKAAPESAGESDESMKQEEVWRGGLRRLYSYVLALLGLAAGSAGLVLLVHSLLEMALGGELLGRTAVRNQLAAGLAMVLVGIPLWVLMWRQISADASQVGEAGDHARGSLLRKGYLYLVLFAGVIGIMVSAGFLLYEIILAILGDPAKNMLAKTAKELASLLLFCGLFAYHWQQLRKDTQLAKQSLERRYAQFPVLILLPEADDFGETLAQALQTQIPGLPIATHSISQGVPDISLDPARAVILPAEMAIRPTEALRVWLQSFNGERILLTLPAAKWYWVPGITQPIHVIARQAAQLVRQLAEGQKPTNQRSSTAWMVAIYILAGLFALEILFLILTLGISLVFN